MDDLPQSLREGNWPIASDIALLKRVEAAHAQLDAKICALTQDLQTSRLYPRKTDSKALRIRLRHSFTPPVSSDADEALAIQGKWTLRIDAMDAKLGIPVSFSTYFRKATIELDPRIYADSIIEWTSFQKAHHNADALEVTRTGHATHTVRIKLLPAHMPERYAISSALTAIISDYLSTSPTTEPTSASTPAYTKQNIVMATWEYIKQHNLIKSDDCRVVVCDDALGRVLECESLPFALVVAALKRHLTPVTSIDLECVIRVDDDAEAAGIEREELVDVDVGAIEPLEKIRESVLADWEERALEQQSELTFLQQQERHIVDQLITHCRKREWMAQFASDPVGFLRDVVQSQLADQQILVAEADSDEFHVPHPQQFGQPWVRDVVASLLTTPAAATSSS